MTATKGREEVGKQEPSGFCRRVINWEAIHRKTLGNTYHREPSQKPRLLASETRTTRSPLSRDSRGPRDTDVDVVCVEISNTGGCPLRSTESSTRNPSPHLTSHVPEAAHGQWGLISASMGPRAYTHTHPPAGAGRATPGDSRRQLGAPRLGHVAPGPGPRHARGRGPTTICDSCSKASTWGVRPSTTAVGTGRCAQAAKPHSSEAAGA